MNLKYSCSYCPANFSLNNNLRRHVKITHPECDIPPALPIGRKPKVVNNPLEFKCNICSEVFNMKHKLYSHRKKHNFLNKEKGPVIKGIFISMQEFLAWKNDEEDRLICRYNICNSHKSSKKTTKYYQCHRNGTYRHRGKGKRHLKSQGSCKSGRCSASIIAHHLNNGAVSIIYFNEHSNHDRDPAHITLHKKEKDRLAELIRLGTSFDDLINTTHYRLGTEDNFHIKFLTKHDLHNIVRSYKIPKSCLHDNDKMMAGLNGSLLVENDVKGDDLVLDNFLNMNCEPIDIRGGEHNYYYNNKANLLGNEGNNFVTLANPSQQVVIKKPKRKRGRKANIAECRRIMDELNRNIENVDVKSVVLLKNLLKQCLGIMTDSVLKTKLLITQSNAEFNNAKQNIKYFVGNQFGFAVLKPDLIQDNTNVALAANYLAIQSQPSYVQQQFGVISNTDYNQHYKSIPPLSSYNSYNMIPVPSSQADLLLQVKNKNASKSERNKIVNILPKTLIRSQPVNIVPKPIVVTASATTNLGLISSTIKTPKPTAMSPTHVQIITINTSTPQVTVSGLKTVNSNLITSRINAANTSQTTSSFDGNKVVKLMYTNVHIASANASKSLNL